MGATVSVIDKRPPHSVLCAEQDKDNRKIVTAILMNSALYGRYVSLINLVL